MADSAASTAVAPRPNLSPRGAPRRRPAPAARPNAPLLQGRGGSSATAMRMYYTDDAPGIKVDPMAVLVFSIVFIAAVFVLHIGGRMFK
ncbi:hypothetical protein M427DRAFT_57787 [Gonapodya prolifera JEL478]|uniref:Protein transport protein Sec61 subunit beta n=1 Tax=Gonapodya prolifera (strain JEL478) TaxID=1344416 RepID=A0A139AC03_GONPJ|nr:hypothetical protein M427DRAFT_57787 [Gonapodya prolifera JEL478]|eukprot:KXS14300.1 hypothetical protein M427DRAFT_57787 [Gonapodya prolifera JEL478]